MQPLCLFYLLSVLVISEILATKHYASRPSRVYSNPFNSSPTNGMGFQMHNSKIRDHTRETSPWDTRSLSRHYPSRHRPAHPTLHYRDQPMRQSSQPTYSQRWPTSNPWRHQTQTYQHTGYSALEAQRQRVNDEIEQQKQEVKRMESLVDLYFSRTPQFGRRPTTNPWRYYTQRYQTRNYRYNMTAMMKERQRINNQLEEQIRQANEMKRQIHSIISGIPQLEFGFSTDSSDSFLRIFGGGHVGHHSRADPLWDNPFPRTHGHGFTYHHQYTGHHGTMDFWVSYRQFHFPHNANTLQVTEAESKPRYEVMCEFSVGYELRHYPNGTWVTTQVRARSYDAAALHGFKKLEHYMEGQNNGRIQMNKTTPIQIAIRSREDEEERLIDPMPRDQAYSVSFYLPEEYQMDPPQPRNNEIFIENTSMYVYAKRFSGWAYGMRSFTKYQEFSQSLHSDGLDVAEGLYYIHVYSLPWQLVDRHNEILIPTNQSALSLCQPKPMPSTDTSPDHSPTQSPEILSTTEEGEPEGIPNGIPQCAEVECPRYEMESSISPKVFLRQVEGGVYAIHKSQSCSLKESLKESYKPLQDYFDGKNSDNITIPRTTPIIQMAMKPSWGPDTCNYTYELSFYLPQEYHEVPPTPIDTTVRLSRQEATFFYVLNFTGSSTPQILGEKYDSLKRVLDNQGLCYQHNTFSVAVYDVPSNRYQQRNEISVPVDEFCNDVGINGDIIINDFYMDTNDILPPEYSIIDN